MMKKIILLLCTLVVAIITTGCYPKVKTTSRLLPNDYFAYYGVTSKDAYEYFKNHPETCTNVQLNDDGIYLTFNDSQYAHNFTTILDEANAKIDEFEKNNENCKVSIYLIEDVPTLSTACDHVDVYCPKDVDPQAVKELVDYVAPRLLYVLLTNNGDLRVVNVRVYEYQTYELLHYHGVG